MSAPTSAHAHERLTAMSAQLRAMATEIEAVAASLDEPQRVTQATEDYVTLCVLCDRVGYAPQTIRNLICQGELKRGTHFVQRQRHGKILFIWPAMERWLRDRALDRSVVEPFIPKHHARPRKVR
jgi:hypothetical protein